MVIYSKWVEIVVRVASKSLYRVHGWEEKGLQNSGKHHILGERVVRGRHACQGSLQVAVGEVRGEGGFGVGIETMQGFEEEIRKQQMSRRSQGRSAQSGLTTTWPQMTKVNQWVLCWHPVSLHWWGPQLSSLVKPLNLYGSLLIL